MPAANNVRPAHITAFSALMSHKYGSTILDKNVHDALTQAAQYVSSLGVANVTQYLKSYAFTLGTFIWYPFDVQSPAQIGDWTLPWQLITIAHEHVHVRQFKETQGKMAPDYINSPESRAMHWEAEAYGVAFEVWAAMYGADTYPPPEQLASPLGAYGCSAPEVQGAAEVLRTRYESIKRGAIITPEANELLNFLKSAQLV